MTEAKVIPFKKPERNLPREFRIHCLKLRKDASDEEIEQRAITSSDKERIHSPNGVLGYPDQLSKDATQMGLPNDLSPYEILRIQELIEFKAVEKKKRLMYSQMLFGHKNATWEKIYERSETLMREDLERFGNAYLPVNILDDYSEYKHLGVLDHIAENQTSQEKCRLQIWKLRQQVKGVWEKIKDHI